MSSDPEAGSSRWPSGLIDIIAPLLLGISSWPLKSLAPAGGLDGSWESALHLSAERGLDFGSQIVFTYGPLGWVFIPRLHNTLTGGTSIIVVALIHFALVLMIYRLSTRSLGWPIGFIVTLVVSQALPLIAPPETALILVLVLCAQILRSPPAEGDGRWIPIIAGVAAAVLMLAKFNVGVMSAAALLIACVAVSKDRLVSLARYAGAFIATFLLLWFATSQSLKAIPEFIRTSLDLASGFSSAMVFEGPDRGSDRSLALIALISLAALAWRAAKDLPRARKLALAGVLGIVSFGMLKHGFVRHDDAHAVFFFSFLLIGSVGFLPKDENRAIALVPLLVLLSCVIAVSQMGALDILDPRPEILGFRSTIADATIHRDDLVRSTRERLRSEYALDGAILDQLEGQGVHIEPWETTVAWAYPEIEWRPVPIFQSYSAYTAGLDDMNAEAFTAGDAPRYILREAGVSVDGRNPTFESPEYSLELVCFYREAFRGARWQLLERSEDRCGEPTPLGTAHASTGEPVPIPIGDPNSLTYFTVEGVGDSLVERVQTIVYRGDRWEIDLPGDGLFRFVPSTSTQAHVLRVPAALDYAPPFEYTSPAQRIELSTIPSEQHDLMLSFFEVPVES